MYYGPDTYMGHNLASMLRALADLPDEVRIPLLSPCTLGALGTRHALQECYVRTVVLPLPCLADPLCWRHVSSTRIVVVHHGVLSCVLGCQMHMY